MLCDILPGSASRRVTGKGLAGRPIGVDGPPLEADLGIAGGAGSGV